MVETAVIIPTIRGVSSQLDRILPQLSTSDRVVVVIADPDLRGVQDACQRDDGRLHYVAAKQRLNPAEARNLGVSVVPEASLLAFADDDDLVAQDWLSNIVAPLKDGCADIAGGVLVMQRHGGGAVVRPQVDYWFRQAVFGGNFALTRRAWEGLGGFNTNLRYCEDTDLAWRAGALGLRITVVEQAIVRCDTRRGLSEFLQRFRWGSASVQLLQLHALGVDHLPTLFDLVEDKMAGGFCSAPMVASLGQWTGQLWGRVTRSWAGSQTRSNTSISM